MRASRVGAISVAALTLVVFGACSADSTPGGEEEPIPFLARCVVVSRPSVFVGHDHRDRIDLGDDMEEGHGEPGELTDIEEFDSGRFTFRANYSDGEYHGRGLTIDVYSRARPKRLLVRTLHQFSRSESPVNVHGPGPGGHGFTGLAYVHDPFSKAELQYYCWHIDVHRAQRASDSR